MPEYLSHTSPISLKVERLAMRLQHKTVFMDTAFYSILASPPTEKERTICNSTFAKHAEQTLSGLDSSEKQLRNEKHTRWCYHLPKKLTKTRYIHFFPRRPENGKFMELRSLKGGNKAKQVVLWALITICLTWRKIPSSHLRRS